MAPPRLSELVTDQFCGYKQALGAKCSGYTYHWYSILDVTLPPKGACTQLLDEEDPSHQGPSWKSILDVILPPKGACTKRCTHHSIRWRRLITPRTKFAKALLMLPSQWGPVSGSPVSCWLVSASHWGLVVGSCLVVSALTPGVGCGLLLGRQCPPTFGRLWLWIYYE
jgi:hypothetical protein